jgi:hypothetical protein
MCRILILFILISNLFFCQETKLNGKVFGKKNTLLEFANVGIKNKNIGTIADVNGFFTIYLPNENLADSLTISYVGYKELHVKITEMVKNKINEFILEETLNELSEVIILSNTKKEIKIGTKSINTLVAGYVRINNDKNRDIQEFAKEVDISKPTRILSLNVNLFNVNVKTAKFRVNFYSIKNNLPFENIGSEKVILTHDIKSGWNKFDVSDYDIKFDKSFFISLEYIPIDDNKDEPFRYSGQLFGKSITRTSSLGTWKTKKGLSISMYITANQ